MTKVALAAIGVVLWLSVELSEVLELCWERYGEPICDPYSMDEEEW